MNINKGRWAAFSPEELRTLLSALQAPEYGDQLGYRMRTEIHTVLNPLPPTPEERAEALINLIAPHINPYGEAPLGMLEEAIVAAIRDAIAAAKDGTS